MFNMKVTSWMLVILCLAMLEGGCMVQGDSIDFCQCLCDKGCTPIKFYSWYKDTKICHCKCKCNEDSFPDDPIFSFPDEPEGPPQDPPHQNIVQPQPPPPCPPVQHVACKPVQNPSSQNPILPPSPEPEPPSKALEPPTPSPGPTTEPPDSPPHHGALPNRYPLPPTSSIVPRCRPRPRPSKQPSSPPVEAPSPNLAAEKVLRKPHKTPYQWFRESKSRPSGSPFRDCQQASKALLAECGPKLAHAFVDPHFNLGEECCGAIKYLRKDCSVYGLVPALNFFPIGVHCRVD